MTKKDLKERMVVETREGNRYLVCGNSIIRDNGYCNLSDYSDNLSVYLLPSLDIIKVYDVVTKVEDIKSPNLTLIWEREHTPEVGDIYVDDTDDEKFIIIAIDKDATYYYTMNICQNFHESNLYSELELQNYRFIGTDTNIVKIFDEAFAALEDYKS